MAKLFSLQHWTHWSPSSRVVAAFGRTVVSRRRERDGRQRQKKKRATGEKRKLSISIKDHDQVFIIFLSSYNNGLVGGLCWMTPMMKWQKNRMQHEEKIVFSLLFISFTDGHRSSASLPPCERSPLRSDREQPHVFYFISMEKWKMQKCSSSGNVKSEFSCPLRRSAHSIDGVVDSQWVSMMRMRIFEL